MKSIFVLFSGLLVFATAKAQPHDIRVDVDARSGSYAVSSESHHWRFAGGIGQPVSDVVKTRGKDAAGAYNSVSFSWRAGIAYVGTIRWYDASPVVMFSITLPEGANGQAVAAFPDFTSIPANLNRFSYHNRIFPLAQFFLEETSTPWMLFNNNREACVISPASDFMVSLMSKGGDSGRITSGLNPEVKKLPAGFSHSTILVMDNGIRKAWDTWGTTLRSLYNRKYPDSDQDVLLKYFGFWTDVGGDYYYSYDTTKGYAGTLLALRDHYKKEGIPLGYVQLDSWWYQKSSNNVYNKRGAEKKIKTLPGGAWNKSGGLMEYTADPFLFPNGLAAFQKQLGLPLVTHNRWIDPASPYHARYKISGLGATDPAFWKEIMSYLKNSGVTNYEQDWINYIYMNNPEMIADITVGNAFTDNMAKAASDHGINMQYCMGLPRYFMQGVKYNNLTTIRTAGDRFKHERWKNFVFTSVLAHEMGIRPWSDVFRSNEIGNMIMSVLSAGAVGTGDSIGTENKANILKACRADGVLVKPDAPLLPMDQHYIQLAAGQLPPVLNYTYTKHRDLHTGYVVAFTDQDTRSRDFAFKLSDAGINKRAVLFEPMKRTIKLLDTTDVYESQMPPDDSIRLYIIAPLTRSGIAFFGDEGKIASTGKKRIADMEETATGLRVKVLFARGEKEIRLAGYSAKKIRSDKGVVKRDETQGFFSVTIQAPAGSDALWVSLW